MSKPVADTVLIERSRLASESLRATAMMVALAMPAVLFALVLGRVLPLHGLPLLFGPLLVGCLALGQGGSVSRHLARPIVLMAMAGGLIGAATAWADPFAVGKGMAWVLGLSIAFGSYLAATAQCPVVPRQGLVAGTLVMTVASLVGLRLGAEAWLLTGAAVAVGAGAIWLFAVLGQVASGTSRGYPLQALRLAGVAAINASAATWLFAIG